MIKVGRVLVSDDVAEQHFVCDLNACKGACCVGGDAGAPLLDSELPILERIWPEVAPYLDEEHRAAVESQGKWVKDDWGHLVTPLRDGEECAYVYFENGIALCAIEKAWRDGKVDWPKPISCHLYPIRVSQFDFLEVEALNYHQWEICDPACDLGKKLQVPIYKFLKEPLIRAYGKDFYAALELAIETGESVDEAVFDPPNKD